MNKKADLKIIQKLFFSTLYISAFTFGGGFVITSFMKKKFVDELHWIDEEEMLDLIALAQSAPGPIAVNAAVLVGWKVGGVLGMVTAVLGTILPPMVILTVVSLLYDVFAANPYVAATLQGMQTGIAAVILDVVWGLGSKVLKQKRPSFIVVMLLAFAATAVFKINVILIILAAALFGIGAEFVSHKRKEERV